MPTYEFMRENVYCSVSWIRLVVPYDTYWAGFMLNIVHLQMA